MMLNPQYSLLAQCHEGAFEDLGRCSRDRLTVGLAEGRSVGIVNVVVRQVVVVVQTNNGRVSEDLVGADIGVDFGFLFLLSVHSRIPICIE